MNIFSNTLQIVAFVLIGIYVGIAVGIYIRKRFIELHLKNIASQGKKLIEKAKREAEQI